MVAYIKAQLGSGKLTQNIQDESVNFSITRCHLPPKSTNFGTLPYMVRGITVPRLGRSNIEKPSIKFPYVKPSWGKCRQ